MLAPPEPSAWPVAVPAVIILMAALAVIILGYDTGASTEVVLLAIPASIGALVAQSAHPRGETDLRGCVLYPVGIMLALLLVGALVLQEGAICLAIAFVPWMAAALTGAIVVAINQRRARALDEKEEQIMAIGWLTLPVVVALLAPPPVDDWRTVERSVIIAAPTAEVWKQLPAIDDIRPDEGRWNVAQDIFQIPRPVGARLDRDASDQLVRHARWGEGIRFEERIQAIRPGRDMRWQFYFPDDSISVRTDRHIHPHSAQLTIENGGYRLDPLAGGAKTKLTLWTRYRQRTALPAYTAWWGERFLGGIQDNVLGIIADRAQASIESGS